MPLEITLVILVCVIAIGLGITHYRDSLHPSVYLGAMLCGLYALMPLHLQGIAGDEFYARFFSKHDFEFVLWINFAGVVSMLTGVFVGSGSTRHRIDSFAALSGQEKIRIQKAAFRIGFVGVAAFAYVRPGLGGWNESGYMRDAYLLTMPALIWLMASYRDCRPGFRDWVKIGVLVLPLLLIGLFNARRGPIFMILVGLAVGWFFMKNTRPSLYTVFLGGGALAILMLVLVVNRDSIQAGEFQMQHSALDFTDASAGNEFIYGAGQILTYAKSEEYMWGRQYIVDFLVRPIPRQIWETKYEDAWDFLGIPNLFEGGPGAYFEKELGWQGEVGAAPGIIADLWWEFSWGYLVAIWLIGFYYGRAWRKAVSVGGKWVTIYGIITSLSVYLIWQALEAFGFNSS